ncbi:MAG: LamG-like jellyroll fold domain-containing protein, partial [Thermoguttaceae bacterium]|nr:LamG-like jellyroll fold domain-containing protein [Thermoguttaceae bacterium]
PSMQVCFRRIPNPKGIVPKPGKRHNISLYEHPYRADGTRILEYAVQPRWLTLELAQGQFVRLSQRGRFSHEAATVDVRIRFRCSVRDADTGRTVGGPESWFTVWLDRVVLRPGERWPWPAATAAGFVEGAMDNAPANRGFEFTGLRRVAFNGASEGTLTAGQFNPDWRSVHWGLEAGTLEFWCRPNWNADDGQEHVFFEGVAYGHRLQSQLRKLDAGGDNQLEFIIADAGGTTRTVRGRAGFTAGRWHHVAATWDFPRAHVALFVDGRPVASQGPGKRPWPSSLMPDDDAEHGGMGISEKDRRSLPMQAFIGGDKQCSGQRSAEAVLDEFRISSVARYSDEFTPRHSEFQVDEQTRALFRFENTSDGVHDSDDRFVRGHLACELPPQEEAVPLETLVDGKIDRRMVVVKPYAPEERFEANRAENRLVATRPFDKLPDPRSVEYRLREAECIVTGPDDELTIEVGGDFEPLMKSITFEHADGSAGASTLLPRWRANDNVVPFSVETLAATLAPDVEDDAEKAFEVFRYALAVTNYYDAHYCETLPARHRARVSYSLIKALNIYPFDQCGPLNYTLRKLFLATGISSNDASGTHHQFQQAFYDGDYRLFDLSPRIYWLERDNATVAGRRDFEEDLYLKLRQGSGVMSALRGRVSRARFGSAERPHCMDFPLRPGERASVCWHNEGRWFELTGDRQPIPLAKVPPYFGNGALLFEPAATGESVALDNLAVDRSGSGPATVRPIDSDRPASLTYRAACPYIFSDAKVGGTYSAEKAGAVSLSLSFDEGKTWTDVWRSDEGEGPIALSLLDHVTARYAYWLKLDFAPASAAKVAGFKVRTTFVASPLSLPGKLALGENRIRFVGGPVTAPIRTVCRWVERYRADWDFSLNSLRYYMNGDEAKRDLFVVAPGAAFPVRVTLHGRQLQAEVSLANLPAGWSASPPAHSVDTGDSDDPATVEFLVQTQSAGEGTIYWFDVVARRADQQRRITAQVLSAEAPLVSEAEQAAELAGNLTRLEDAELSGDGGVQFLGDGELTFQIDVPRPGRYALWLRARWNADANHAMRLGVNRDAVRAFSPTAMIGFTDWTDPRYAHTKMFAHFGEQYGHWSWYRLPDVELPAGRQRLTLGANHGACFDALLLLPQNAGMDRAAMNLLQNWNYAPWDNPL